MPNHTSRIGSTIGRYKLLEEIGEGGFGIVYKAAQTNPVKRRVALKVIKPGMDSKEVIARFEAERQALALMDHPNISHVHDAGATDNGHPYFVMELVKGIPITTFCDSRNLDTKARLELFVDVCSAVQHAHQKGIIHRDLKPSNILVSAQHEEPVVKVIDFGIAKAISMELTEKTVYTELGRMIGTPQYMSPEQAQNNVVDVDTRSDIHSLGVILYELLTGRTPLDSEKLRNADYAEIQSMIRHEQPVKPSACLTSLGDTLPLVAQKRGTEQGRLHKTLRGDLDWIVMKALEKDRSRRYQTTNGLAVDIRRYLNSEPVSASPPSATYRLVQFTKKHRTGVTWSAVISMVILVALIVTLLFTVSASKKATEASKKATEEKWKGDFRAVDTLRTNKNEPDRRFKSLYGHQDEPGIEDLAKTIPSRLAEELGPLGEMLGSRWTRLLRDMAISVLAIADLHQINDPVIVLKKDDLPIVAINRAQTKSAHSCNGNHIEIRDLRTGHTERFKATGEPTSLKFSPDGHTLAVVAADVPTIELWRHKKEKGWLRIDTILKTGGPFAFFPVGKRCAVATNNAIEIIDWRAGARIDRLCALEGAPNSISVSRDGELVAVSIPEEGRVAIIKVEEGTREPDILCKNPEALAWGTVDDSLAVCTRDSLEVWRRQDWEAGAGAASLKLRESVDLIEDDVAWSPDGRLLASLRSLDRTTRLWDPFQGGEPLCHHAGTSDNLEFSDDGRKLGLFRNAPEDLELYVYEVESGDVCLRGQKHAGESEFGVGGIYDGVWNEKGSLLAISGSDGVLLCNRDADALGHLEISDGADGVAFSDDAFFVATSGGLLKWTMESSMDDSGLMVVEFKKEGKEELGEFSDCKQASIHEDWLAVAAKSAGADARRALWLINLEDGEPEPYRLPGSEGATTCAISADGCWIAAVLRDPQAISDRCRIAVWAMPDDGNFPQRPETIDQPGVGVAARIAFSPRPSNPETGKLTEGPVSWLVTGDSKNYQFWRTGSWELDANQTIPSNMGERSGRIAFSSRGTALAIAIDEDVITFYAPPSAELPKPIELSTPDFDTEIPVCFSPCGRILITAKPTGHTFFWRLDLVRSELRKLGLDWGLRQFETPDPSDRGKVGRIVLPATDR